MKRPATYARCVSFLRRWSILTLVFAVPVLVLLREVKWSPMTARAPAAQERRFTHPGQHVLSLRGGCGQHQRPLEHHERQRDLQLHRSGRELARRLRPDAADPAVPSAVQA